MEWKSSSRTMNRSNNPHYFYLSAPLSSQFKKEKLLFTSLCSAAMPTILSAGDSHVFNLLHSKAARALWWFPHAADVHAETDLSPRNVQNTNGLTWYLESFHLRIYSSWTAELGWRFLASLAPQCCAEKKLRLFQGSPALVNGLFVRVVLPPVLVVWTLSLLLFNYSKSVKD